MKMVWPSDLTCKMRYNTNQLQQDAKKGEKDECVVIRAHVGKPKIRDEANTLGE